MQISEVRTHRVSTVAAEGDTSTTIADLAKFIHFDPLDIGRYQTSAASVMYEALEDEYGAFEKDDGACEYDSAWMSFSDGSRIVITKI